MYNNGRYSFNKYMKSRQQSAYRQNPYDSRFYDNDYNDRKHFTDYNNSPDYEMKDYNRDCYHNTTDYGPEPFVINITEATIRNDNFRTALWTGKYLQLTLMSINVGEDIGLEIHPDLDQFLRIEKGQGIVQMGCRKDRLDFQKNVYDDYAIIIPAGTWHNIINTGCTPLKLYSIYAPPQHPKGTVHQTKADAEAAERYNMH